MRLVFAVLLAFVLVGCAGTNFSWDSARQVKAGMKEDEVVKIMGRPTRVSSGPNGSIWVWVWVNPYSETRTFAITMKDGEVTKLPDIPKSYN